MVAAKRNLAAQSGAVTRRTFLAGTAGTTLIMGLGSVLPGCSREEAVDDLQRVVRSSSAAW